MSIYGDGGILLYPVSWTLWPVRLGCIAGRYHRVHWPKGFCFINQIFWLLTAVFNATEEGRGRLQKHFVIKTNFWLMNFVRSTNPGLS